jgi:hypothetical protein
MKKIKTLIKYGFIAYFIPTFLFSGCVTQRAVSSYEAAIPGGNGSVLVEPRWEYEETGASKAMPYILGAAGGAAGYLLTPEPTPQPTVVTNNRNQQQQEEGDPRITNALIGLAAGYLLPLGIKALVVSGKKKKYVPTESEAKKWISKYNDYNGHKGGNAYQLYRNEPSTSSLIMFPKDLMPKDSRDSPIPKDNPVKHIEMKPWVFFYNEVFPSFIYSTATTQYKNMSGALGMFIKSNHKGLTFKYEIECQNKKFFDKIQGEYTTEKGNNESELFLPKIPWNYEALIRNTEKIPVPIFFRIYDTNGNKKEKLETVSIHPINECLLWCKFGDEDFEMNFSFAAYVNENHPMIPEILQEALSKKYVEAIGSSAGNVDKQVEAIWKVLRSKGIKYSSITTTTQSNENIFSQYVRRFGEAIKTQQANCVDGTVVFASILRRMELNPVIVLVPGHAFLGYYNDDIEKIKFLETTMLGTKASFKEAQEAGMEQFIKWDNHKKARLVDIKKSRNSVSPLND